MKKDYITYIRRKFEKGNLIKASIGYKEWIRKEQNVRIDNNDN